MRSRESSSPPGGYWFLLWLALTVQGCAHATSLSTTTITPSSALSSSSALYRSASLVSWVKTKPKSWLDKAVHRASSSTAASDSSLSSTATSSRNNRRREWAEDDREPLPFHQHSSADTEPAPQRLAGLAGQVQGLSLKLLEGRRNHRNDDSIPDASRRRSIAAAVLSPWQEARATTTTTANGQPFYAPTSVASFLSPAAAAAAVRQVSNQVSQSINHKRLALKEAAAVTLDEVRQMRGQMESLVRDLKSLKEQFVTRGSKQSSNMAAVELTPEERERQRVAQLEGIAPELEAWATKIIQEGTDEGWQFIKCNSFLRRSINPRDETKAFLKWIKDPRSLPFRGHDKAEDERTYPCMKVHSVIDAPAELVRLFMAQEYCFKDWNTVVDQYGELEVFSPQSKLCWATTPALVVLAPRRSINFCTHKWIGQTLFIASQACDEKDPAAMTPANRKRMREDIIRGSKQRNAQPEKFPLSYTLRSACFIRPHQDNPATQTLVTMVTHGNPGHGVPKWAIHAGVQALAYVEPFQLFHRVRTQIEQHRSELERLWRAEVAAEATQRRGSSLASSRRSSTTTATPVAPLPVAAVDASTAATTKSLTTSMTPTERVGRSAVGVAQLGYAVFWSGASNLVIPPKPQVTPAARRKKRPSPKSSNHPPKEGDRPQTPTGSTPATTRGP